MIREDGGVTPGLTPRREAVLSTLAAGVLAVRRDHPVRVAIDGRSAAGKTTLAQELAAVLRARTTRAVIDVDIDHFMRPVAHRTMFDLNTPESYYLDSWDVRAIREELLLPLGPGGSRRYRAMVTDPHGAPVDSPVGTAPDDAILVAAGVFLYRPEVRDLWDLGIWVEVGAAESLRRGVARDHVWMASPEVAERRYRTKYLPGEDRYIDEVGPMERVRFVVDNHDPDAPALRDRTLAWEI